MQYSLEQIKTVEECNALLSILNKDKEATQSKLGMQKISIDRHESTTEDTFSELAASQPILDSLNTMLLTLPEGNVKNKYIKDRERLELRLSILNERKGQYSKEDLIIKQLEYKRMENDLPLFDELITQVEAKKASL
jgi:hypothetical protein